MIYKIVIPTLSRYHTISDKTLKLCQKLNIDFSNIYLFILKKEEIQYKNILNNTKINIIVTDISEGLDNMRNYITHYFNQNELLLSMDDDIEDIYKLVIDNSIENIKSSKRYRLKSLDADEFNNIIENGFKYCLENNIGLFGIYPVKNGYFMKDLPEITTDLRFCVGTFWGCINNHSIKINIEEKEDYDRTLQYYIKDHKVLRLNNICILTKYYKNKGGMQKSYQNRIDNSKISTEYLIKNYPLYCKFYKIKKSGISEIKLIN